MSAVEVTTNGLTVTASVAYAAGATSITVNAPTVGPTIPALGAGQQMHCNWDGEIILVTANSGTGNVNWTITRAQEGTTAIAHLVNSVITQCATAAGIQQTILDTLQPLPPYIFDNFNSRYYLPSDSMYLATRPSTSPSYLSGTPTATTAGTNGGIMVDNSGGATSPIFITLNGSARVEAVISAINTAADNSATFTHAGIWLWDSAHNFIYLFYPSYNAGAANGGKIVWFFQKWTYNGSGNPTFSSTLNTLDTGYQGYGTTAHMKLSLSGTTLSAQVSLDGGQTFFTVATVTVAGIVITKGGYDVSGSCVANIFSLVVA